MGRLIISLRVEGLSKNLYGSLAKGLLIGDREDKLLALEIAKFVQQMPSTHSRHDVLVAQFGDSKNYVLIKESLLSSAPIEMNNDKSKNRDGC
jgi:hypothetical protein